MLALIMSRGSAESDIKRVIDYLDDRDRAHRKSEDEKIQRILKDADDMARVLKNVLDNVHRHWA